LEKVRLLETEIITKNVFRTVKPHCATKLNISVV